MRGAVAGGLTTAGRLDEAIAIGEELLASGAPQTELLYALDGLGDSAIYQGRLDDGVRFGRLMRDAGAAAGDDLYVDYGTIGVALAEAYGGHPDVALSLLADGPASRAPSLTAWFEYVRGEAILDQDPPAALAHLERAEAIARSVGHRFLLEVALLSVSSLKARIGEVGESADRFVALLDHFGVGGDPGHLVTTLRNLVVLLVRLERHRAAAALYGAVVDHPSSPTYGAEAERLAAAAAECRQVLGDAELERVVAVGRARPFQASVDAARTALLAARGGAAVPARQ